MKLPFYSIFKMQKNAFHKMIQTVIWSHQLHFTVLIIWCTMNYAYKWMKFKVFVAWLLCEVTRTFFFWEWHCKGTWPFSHEGWRIKSTFDDMFSWFVCMECQIKTNEMNKRAFSRERLHFWNQWNSPKKARKKVGWLPLFQFISCTYTILCWRNLHAKFHPQIPCNFYFMAHYVCKFDLFGVSFKFWQFPSKWQNRKSFTYIHSTLQESCVMSHKCAWQISARLVE